ncbi:MAG: alpha/beta hydrolase [Nitrosospira sp.]
MRTKFPGSRLNPSERHPPFDMPVFFLPGRYDRHVPATLAEQYFARIKAPFKCLVWFEQSAHNPLFEEPAKFNQVLIERVLPLSEPTCHQ